MCDSHLCKKIVSIAEKYGFLQQMVALDEFEVPHSNMLGRLHIKTSANPRKNYFASKTVVILMRATRFVMLKKRITLLHLISLLSFDVSAE